MRRLAMLFLFVCVTSSSSAALLRYEPFNYPNETVGTTVEGKTNPDGETWVSAYGNTPPSLMTVASNSLALPPQMPAAIGNSGKVKGTTVSTASSTEQSGKALRLPLDDNGATVATVNGGNTVYYSLALRADAMPFTNNMGGGFFIGLNNGGAASTTNPSAAAARLQARIDPTDGTKYNLGIVRNRATTAADVPWTGPLTVGDTLFVVASIELRPGTFNDVARLWINPDPSTFRDPLFSPLTTPPTVIDDTVGVGTIGTDIGIASIILRQSPTPDFTLDELRVGTDWASVTVPEPASLWLLLIGLSFGFSCRRAR